MKRKRIYIIIAVLLIGAVFETTRLLLEHNKMVPSHSKDTETIMRTIRDAVELYRMEKGHLPYALREIFQNDIKHSDDHYLDGWGNALIYRKNAASKGNYELFSAGRDGMYETNDDLKIVFRIDGTSEENWN
jgi:hypothetical protein